jgi:DNA-directed RNA polymerase alpha subunit
MIDKLKNLKIIERKENKSKIYISTISSEKKETIETNDIKLPKNIKVINKTKKLFNINSENFKIRIIMKIEVRIKKKYI